MKTRASFDATELRIALADVWDAHALTITLSIAVAAMFVLTYIIAHLIAVARAEHIDLCLQATEYTRAQCEFLVRTGIKP